MYGVGLRLLPNPPRQGRRQKRCPSMSPQQPPYTNRNFATGPLDSQAQSLEYDSDAQSHTRRMCYPMASTNVFTASYVGLVGRYKMRKQIAQALQARSKAIRAALDRYNEAAQAFRPPRRILSWDEVVEYGFVADFDLLRDTRQDIRDRPWAQPLNRALMDEWFRIERARKEVQHLNVEIRRVVTHIRDEHNYLTAAERDALSLDPPDPILAFHIRLYREERGRFSSVHTERFKRLATLPGFTGTLEPGTSIDPTLQSRRSTSERQNSNEAADTTVTNAAMTGVLSNGGDSEADARHEVGANEQECCNGAGSAAGEDEEQIDEDEGGEDAKQALDAQLEVLLEVSEEQ
ncbi:hypothetical protein NMY22_g20036 [Coprinellus aureogranulatus]|nr:hypothetical protein NMY22_g20036 [Coprinellus aureogranulatus]